MTLLKTTILITIIISLSKGSRL